MDRHTARCLPPAITAFGLGAGIVCVLAFARSEPAPRAAPGPIACWAADRDGSRVFGLDRDLIVARTLVVDHPLDVEPAPDGGLWVLRASAASRASTHRLDRFSADGVLITQLFVERALDLGVLRLGGEALVIEARSGHPTRAIRVRPEGSVLPILERDDLLCCEGSRAGDALLGTSGGAVLRVDPSSCVIRTEVQLGGRIVDLEPGPQPGSVFVLDAAGAGRVLFLDADLAVRWSAPIGHAARHLSAVPGEERVWLASIVDPCALRFGSGGVREIERCGLPLAGLDRTLALSGGGVLIAAPGAILSLDHAGNTAPGQGGFGWVADLAPYSF